MTQKEIRKILKAAKAGTELRITFRADSQFSTLLLVTVKPDRGINCGAKTGDSSQRAFICRKKFLDGSDGEEFSINDLIVAGAKLVKSVRT